MTVHCIFCSAWQVDLSLNPERRDAMVEAAKGVKTLPQLHVDGEARAPLDA